MTLDLKKLQKQLEIDEGVKYYIYLDSLNYPTFGIGHLLRKEDPEYTLWVNRKPKQKIEVSKERVAEVFEQDCQLVINDCYQFLPSFDEYPEEIKQIVANMMFNLGLTKMLKLFKQLRQALIIRDYRRAALEMQYVDGNNPAKGETDWVKQTKARARRLIKRMAALSSTTKDLSRNNLIDNL